MNKVQKTISAIATLGVVAGITVAFNATGNVSAKSDNSENGRTEYTLKQIQNGESGSAIFFNSITDGSFGNEFNFVGAREDTGVNVGTDNVWSGNEITVEPGKTYLVRMYVHNNNPYGYNGVAENVKATFALSKDYATENTITGYISSSNATPSLYWDSVVFKSSNGQSFYLDYVEGSASVENNGYAKGGASLSDNIITSGVMLGYDQAGDGKIPGCYQYSQFLGIKVTPVFTDEEYTVDKTVRIAGSEDKTWYDSIYANVGDTVEYQIHYKNTTEGTATNVTVQDNLPSNLKVASNPILYNTSTTSNGKTGLEVSDFTVSPTGIGDYAINGNAYLRFTATVVDEDLACGKNILRNWVKVSVAGKYTKLDSADIIVEKTCETTTIKTRWILEDGTVLKDWIDGSFPDEEGDDYPEYEFVHYYADKEGNITNVYRKKEEVKKVYTKWILEDGTVLKDWTEGTYPDTEGDDFPAYEFVKYYTDENGNTINVYRKKAAQTTELPKTGPVAGSILGAGSIVTSLGYFIKSRRTLR